MQAPDQITAQIANCDAIIAQAMEQKKRLEALQRTVVNPDLQNKITAALRKLNKTHFKSAKSAR